MIRGLFGRLLAVMCGVAAASLALVLVLQERSLSQDLQRAAERRLATAATAADRLVAAHLHSMSERYRAISGTPQFRATLEVNDGPTLDHYAETLLQQHGAGRIAFVDAEGRVAGGAGDAALDAVGLGVRGQGVVELEGRPHAAVAVDLARSGRLLAIEPIGDEILAQWSELCGAGVSFARAGAPSDAELMQPVRGVGRLELRVTSSLAAEREAMANARWSLIAAGALGLALAFCVSLALSRGLVRPIQRIQSAAQRIGAGDLTLRIDASRKDEIGDVARSFDEMTRELGDTIRAVVDAADRVEGTASGIGQGTRRLLEVAEAQHGDNDRAKETLAEIHARVESIASAAGESARRLDASMDGSSTSFRQLAASGEVLKENAGILGLRSEEITASIQQVAAGAQQVAADTEGLLPAVDSTVARIDEMAEVARTVNSHTDETLHLSANVVESAEEGHRVVRDAVEGMETTRDTIRESERVIEALRRQVDQIGRVLEMIDDVTDETGLLALNGSIIAAQAGEQGRAFSVVADQLQSLATRVREGTREIDGVVRAVQTETANVVESIARGSERADAGAELILNAQKALSAITSAAHESKDRMSESVAATARQLEHAAAVAAAMQDVRAGVDRIRTVTREQAEATGVVRGSADALHEIAKQVEATVASQTLGAARIGESVEAVQRVVGDITRSLEEQVAASDQVTEVVGGAGRHTAAQQESADQIARAAQALEAQAQTLRDAVRRFRIGG